MKIKYILLAASLIFISCVLIGTVSAVDVESALNDDDPNNLHACKQVSNIKQQISYDGKVIKTYGKDHSASVDFDEKDIKKAKNNWKGVTKKAKGKVLVKKITKKYKKVTIVKKFTCWIKTDHGLKMHKKYFKNYYKYQAKGYKITGKWVGKKCICTAKKTVKKFTGYKTKWVKSGLTAKLTYEEAGQGDEGYYIDFYPTKCHTDPWYHMTYKAKFYIK